MSPYPGRSRKKIFSHKRRLRRMTGSVSRKVTPGTTDTPAGPRPRLQRSAGKGFDLRITRRGWISLGAAVGAVLLVVLLVKVTRTPFISSVSLQGGSVQTVNPVPLEVVFGRGINGGELALTLDDEDRTGESSLDGRTLRAELDTPDGEHRLDIVYRGKVERSIAFRVDTTPPVILVEEMTPQEDGTTLVKGRVEDAVAMSLEGGALPFDRNGAFSFKVSPSDYPMVKLDAVDAAGNRSELALDTIPPPKIKGIHVSIAYAADAKLFGSMVDLVNRTELNGMEIDIKDETGYIGYDSKIPLADQAGTDMPSGGMNLGKVMDKCWYNDIYPIGRVVCFQDNVLPKKRTDLAVQVAGGGLWKDPKGFTYLDPYNIENWDYIVDIAKEAGANGYKEIQFDYMRFPSDGNVTTCVFPKYDGRTKDQVITEFVKYLRDQLKPQGIRLSGDVFGLIASKQGSMGIGQDATTLGTYFDYLCPMVYPSHYNRGEYNISVPENSPHDIVFLSLEDFKKKLEGTGCRLRPWLQDFSLKVNYTPDMVRAQIQACYDAGVEEWLLWDPLCTFSEAALEPAR